MSIAIIVILISALILGGASISGGIMAGFIMFSSMAVIYTQFGDWLKRIIVRWRVFLDFTISASIVGALGTTALGVISAITCGLLVTLGLHSQKHILEHESMLMKDCMEVLRLAKKM